MTFLHRRSSSTGTAAVAKPQPLGHHYTATNSQPTARTWRRILRKRRPPPISTAPLPTSSAIEDDDDETMPFTHPSPSGSSSRSLELTRSPSLSPSGSPWTSSESLLDDEDDLAAPPSTPTDERAKRVYTSATGRCDMYVAVGWAVPTPVSSPAASP